MTDSIVYGKADDNVFILRFKVPLTELLAHPGGPTILKDKIKKEVLPELKEGDMILNTNIPEYILNEAGLSESQYTKAIEQIPDKPKTTKKVQRKL